MMRSLYAGISGLKNHQTRMDVIGNNIANVNTTGFKSSTVTFQDMLSQTIQGASGASGDRGGTNPVQIGMGMGLASINTVFTDGSFQATGKQTDLAISGQGFFVLSDGSNQVYTRAGGFDFDTAGNLLVPGTGYKVMGYKADSSGAIDSNQAIESIQIPVGTSMAARTSSGITYANNLMSSATAIGTAAEIADADAALIAAQTATAAAVIATSAAAALNPTDADKAAGAAIVTATTADMAAANAIINDNVAAAALITATTADTAATTAAAISGATAASVAAAVTAAASGSAGDTAAAAAITAGATAADVAAAVAATLVTATDAKAVTAAAVVANPATTASKAIIIAAATTLTTAQAIAAATLGAATAATDLTAANAAVTAANDKSSDAVSSISVYDSQGNAYQVSGTFEKTADNIWSFTPATTIKDDSGITTATVTASTSPITITFNANGSFNTSTSATIDVTPTGEYAGAATFSITPDFSTMTQYGSATSVAATSQDGYASGSLTKTSINSSGIIVGQFDNGQILNLAQVALANFNNPSGLGKSGDSLYVKTTNSGEAQVGIPGVSGRGSLNAGSLEMSNVDLAQQFSDMIVTQRGFQANSKIITTTDSMLEELVNLKR